VEILLAKLKASRLFSELVVLISRDLEGKVAEKYSHLTSGCLATGNAVSWLKGSDTRTPAIDGSHRSKVGGVLLGK
jgi:hypothetical protein